MKVLQFRGVALALSLLVLQAGAVNAEIDGNVLSLERAMAELGHADAQYILGVMYRDGLGVPRDYKAAVEWYGKAAEQGHADAQFYLGVMYNFGTGTPQDYKAAVKWWRKAAEQGDAQAQQHLGNSYLTGAGVLQDDVKGSAWALVAAMNGSRSLLDWITNNGRLAAVRREAQSRAKEISEELETKKKIAAASEDELMSDLGIKPSASSSGLLLNGGLVLTCFHGVVDAKRVSVIQGGKEFPCKILSKDPVNDIAILSLLSEKPPEGVTLDLAENIKQGEKVFTLGYPLPSIEGHSIKFVSGDISALSGIQDDPRMLQTTMPVHGGNSGGPAFNSKGEFVGIVTSKLNALGVFEYAGELTEGVSYILKADYVIPMLKRLDISVAETNADSESVDLLTLIETTKPYVVRVLAY
jgi:S1-C subfamily serine protease